MYSDTMANHNGPADPYAENVSYAAAIPDTKPPAALDADKPMRDRSRSRSPRRDVAPRRSSPSRRPANAPSAPKPGPVLGVFGLSIRTAERDLEDLFTKWGEVKKVTIVYDQRSDRSRGFGFIEMGTTDDATKCVQELNGVELNGRRIRVDYSVTDRPHQSTPGQYMGNRERRGGGGRYGYSGGGRDNYGGRDSYSSRDRYDRYDRDGGRDGGRDSGRADKDPYGRDERRDDRRDHRDHRDRSPARGGGRGYSPSRRRSGASRSPPAKREYDSDRRARY